MNFVYARFESVPGDLTVDKLTSMIQAEFPETRIINRDWYGEFRRKEVATIERLRREGKGTERRQPETSRRERPGTIPPLPRLNCHK